MEVTGERHHNAAGQSDGGLSSSFRTVMPIDLPSPSPSGEQEAATAKAAGATREIEGAVMPVTDVMALLQAMREEQLDSLKKIADGVQQLQSQVMVLGESASASEGNTSLLLDRLASLEVRIGSIPMPMQPQMKAPPRVQQHQQPRQQSRHDVRASFGGGGPAAGGAQGAMKSLPPAARKVPLPPPAAKEEHGRTPTWQGRGEPEPPRPHFMRNASPQQSSVSSAKTVPTATSVKAVVSATGGGSLERGAGSFRVSPEEAAKKEAKRLAFMEDRARIQARISAKKGSEAGPRIGEPAQTNTAPPTPATGESATVQAQPRAFETPSAGLSSPFAAPAGGGSFSATPKGLGAGGGVEGNGNEAAWLEREKEQREQRERARREEEQRVERQQAEAKRIREEEEARKVREAEEVRQREKARREAEAKRQAKTRILMSSLFDKDADEGNSLFGGIGGASLPVFHDDNTNKKHGGGGGGGGSLDETEEKRVASASSITEVAPTALSTGVETDRGRSGTGLFGGMEEPAATRGGMFDAIDKAGSSRLEGESSAMAGLSSARDADSANEGSVAGGVMQSEAETFRSQLVSRSGAGHSGGQNGDEPSVEPGGYSGLFDSSPPLEGSSSFRGKSSVAATDPRMTVTADGPTDEIEDFFSKLETAESSAPSGTVDSSGPTTAARASIFEDDDLFGSTFAGEAGRAEAAKKTSAMEDVRGADGGSSLFDRPEFSIESGEDDAGNVFGGGGGGMSGGAAGIRDASTSFLSAMGDVGLLPSDDDGVATRGGGTGGVDAGGEGMVEVSL